MTGAEDLMMPVQRVEMATDDLGMSATIGRLDARHRPRVRRIARAPLFPLGARFAVIGHGAAAVPAAGIPEPR